MFLRFIHVVWISSLFVFIAELCSVEWIYHSLFPIYLGMDIWVLSRYGLLLIKLWTFSYKSSLDMFFFLLGNYIGVEIVVLCDTCVFTYNEWIKCFLLAVVPFSLPTNSVWESQLLHSLTTFGDVRILNLALLVVFFLVSHYGFHFHFQDDW